MKPNDCYFCGHSTEILSGGKKLVNCEHCGVCGPYADTEERATELWNSLGIFVSALTINHNKELERREFVKAAMQGLCASVSIQQTFDERGHYTDFCADEAVKVADATLAALEKK